MFMIILNLQDATDTSLLNFWHILSCTELFIKMLKLNLNCVTQFIIECSKLLNKCAVSRSLHASFVTHNDDNEIVQKIQGSKQRQIGERAILKSRAFT